MPELAKRWDVSPDAKTYTFHLRQGVKFAPIPPVNGRELTSHDVKWSFEYWSRTGQFKGKKLPQGQFEWMFEGLEAVAAPDPSTVVVHFKESFAPFLSYAAHDFNPVVAHEIYDADGHLKDRIVGSGPFQLDPAASQKGTRWVWKKNRNYWETGKPYADELRSLVLNDEASIHAAFQTRQLDVLAERVLARDAEELHRKYPQAIQYEYTDAVPIHIYLSNKTPPLDNPLVRKAVALAIDRDEFIRILADGKGDWAMAGAFPDTFRQEEVRQILRHDPAEARRVLAQAGYPNGVSVDFEVPTDRGQFQVTQMELLQAQLKKAGINLVPKPLAYAEYSTLKKKHGHSMNTTTKDVQGDIDAYLYAVYHPKSKNNYDEVNDPKLTQLLEAQRREPDPAKRQELIREAVRHLNAGCYCGQALFFGTYYRFWQPYVKGYTPNHNRTSWGPVWEAWLDK